MISAILVAGLIHSPRIAKTIDVKPLKVVDAQVPPAPSRLIPKPQRSTLNWNKPVIFGALIDRSRKTDEANSRLLNSGIANRFFGSPKSTKILPLRVAALAEPTGLDGFNLLISQKEVVIEGDGPTGIRNAIRTLTGLIAPRNGAFALPTGIVISHPATAWRGVHLFVGPNALDFHQKLWTRLLLPLGFNKVVLQCERTEWDCLPNVRGGINMKRGDLAKLCDWYRSVGVEPIPLIQSFGHAEWLFQNKGNRGLALNPDKPYAVDPRNPSVAELFTRLWSEVIQVTKAKTIHFGLDEVDMTGFPGDHRMMTALWQRQWVTLAAIARQQKVPFMFWGDMALAPTEAPDAANSPDVETASERRSVIPRGSFVTDWHYKADQNAATFMGNLLMWEREGFQPIAATWYRPENIVGFFNAATAHGFGVLQTTWAGYESNETNMLLHPEQFSAMVLAGDYGWSGREEPLAKLGYSPESEFQRRYFSTPSPISPVPGLALTWSTATQPKRLGDFNFRLGSPLSANPTVELSGSARARELVLALDVTQPGKEGEAIGSIQISFGNRTIETELKYGLDVRAASDGKSTYRTERSSGLSLVRIPLSNSVKFDRIIIQSKSPIEIRMHGILAL